MSLFTKTLSLVFLTIGTSLASFAQENKISIEIDPATFVFKGYSLHLRLQPKNSEHLSLGLGIYALDMPDPLVNLNAKNKDKAWKVRIDKAIALFAEYHFTEVNRKWFAGAQVGLQEFKIENDDLNGEVNFTNLLAMGYMGYTFRPFENNFYIKSWAGIGYTSKTSGENILQTETYDIAPISIFATVHLGYTF